MEELSINEKIERNIKLALALANKSTQKDMNEFIYSIIDLSYQPDIDLAEGKGSLTKILAWDCEVFEKQLDTDFETLNKI